MKKNIQIIYQDNDLLAINKPAGLVVHPVKPAVAGHGAGDQPTIVDWIKENYPETKNVGDDPALRPGIVHRLDKETSGVMIVAKNQKAFEFLKKQFQNRETRKEYVALVDGSLKKDWGIINKPLGRSKKDFRKKTATGNAIGKVREAITEYKVLEKLNGYSLVLVVPKTGRTHQIRAHMRALGHPVAGDKLYGFKNSISPKGLERQFLHARTLELQLPNSKKIKIEAKLPVDLEEVLRELRPK